MEYFLKNPFSIIDETIVYFIISNTRGSMSQYRSPDDIRAVGLMVSEDFLKVFY